MSTQSSSSSSSDNNKSWQTLKEEGKNHFRDGDYTGALVSFQQALEKAEEVGAPSVDREILLSNSVASRLKIGGAEMACVAVEEAKKCIALNNRWAKAHIRLASAYIALGGHSNDACQALQNAIRLEPSNTTAKEMLMRELRNRDSGDRNHIDTSEDDDDDNDDDDHNNNHESNPTYVNEDEYTNNNARPSAPPIDEYDDDIDDSPTTMQRILHLWQNIKAWYEEDLSDNWRSLLHVMALILVLYVAFGGRFGLGESPFTNRHSSHIGSGRSSQRCYDTANGERQCQNSDEDYGGRMGNYGEGNAYDDFYNDRRRATNNYHNRHGSSYGSNQHHREAYETNHDHQYKRYDRYNSYDQNYYENNSYNQQQDRYGRRTSGGYGSYNHDRDDYYYSSNRNRNRNYRQSSEYDDIYRNMIIVAIIFGINKMFGVPMRQMGLGLGMGRFFGGRGIGVRFGVGGNGRIRFGGYGGIPMGVGFGGGRGRFGRRGWY